MKAPEITKVQTSVPLSLDKDNDVMQHFASEYSDQAKIKISRKFDDYLGGILRSVDIEDGSNRYKRYCLSFKKEDVWFESVEELLQWSRGQNVNKRFRDLDFGQAVTGAIALIIVLIIGYWAIFIGKDPPGYLGTALTTILGFYFGRASSTHE